jgi:uncharacterized protein YkwD
MATRNIPRRPLLCLLLVAPVAACAGRAPVGEFGTWDPNVEATPEIAALERQLFARLNKDRRRHGLGPLEYDERLADVGRFHSQDMRDHDFFEHESPTTGLLEDRLVRAGYLATEMRENLAIAGDVDAAADNLLESPGHRANILSTTVSHVGIGIVRGDSSGDERALTVTQVFAKPAHLDTPDEALAAVRSELSAARKKRGLAPLASHPLLEKLAERFISDLPDDVPEGAVDDIGDRVTAELNDEEDHGLSAVGVVAQRMFSASELSLPSAIGEAAMRHMGAAAAEARDERGRPRVKMLVLLGRAR